MVSVSFADQTVGDLRKNFNVIRLQKKPKAFSNQQCRTRVRRLHFTRLNRGHLRNIKTDDVGQIGSEALCTEY